MTLHFTKMHALGNDFILIDNRKVRLKKISRLSKTLCNRRFGIGADQLLLLCLSKTVDFKMRIFNGDGTEVEMCGNGIRCLAKHIWDNKVRGQESGVRRKKTASTKQQLAVETLAGIIRLQKSGELIKVDMGEPNPLPVIDYPLKIDDMVFNINCVSMGNPHAIIVVKNVQSFPVSHYGPIIEKHRFFPKRTNVEFIQILNRSNIKMRVWERGAGETMACGTGASAAVVASALLGLTQRKVTVHLPGGKLLIEWSVKDNHVYMTGPAVKVFEGTINLKERSL